MQSKNMSKIIKKILCIKNILSKIKKIMVMIMITKEKKEI
jgi:hypothetical protein